MSRCSKNRKPAFYAWIERHKDWRERVKLGDLILVLDIGGGTTDFTLIAVTEQQGELALERMAVGEHILLGGDNMDLALARLVAGELAEKGTRIDTLQLHALWHNCRVAKEKLLAPGARTKEQPVTILWKRHGPRRRHYQGHAAPRGTLIVCSARVSFRRYPAPKCRSASGAWVCRKSACPMPPTAAVTKHMAQFLRQQASSGRARARTPRPVWSGRANARSVQRRRAACAPDPRSSHRSARLLARCRRLTVPSSPSRAKI